MRVPSPHLHSKCPYHWVLATIKCVNFCTSRQGKSWRFEYTGDPEPLARPGKEDGSDEMNYTGSTGYRSMMGLDITGNIPFKRPAAMHIVRKIPANWTTDEVLVAVKSAMFEMSDWLLQVEAAEATKSDMQDDDLTEENAHLDPIKGTFSDLYSDTPDYTEGGDASYLSGLQIEQGMKQYGSTSRFKRIEEGDENEAIEEEKECRSGSEEEELEEDDSDETSSPPPRYDNNEHSPPTLLAPFHTDFHSSVPIQQHTCTHTRVRTCTASDRVSIMFYAFTDASNNKAKWLGKNEKLTRLKFQGGLERVLRLKMTWQQFDCLWTRVDSLRSGDLSFQGFQNVFYNADNDSSSEGTVRAYVISLPLTFQERWSFISFVLYLMALLRHVRLYFIHLLPLLFLFFPPPLDPCRLHPLLSPPLPSLHLNNT